MMFKLIFVFMMFKPIQAFMMFELIFAPTPPPPPTSTPTRLPYTQSPTNCMPEANAADCEYWRGLGNCVNEYRAWMVVNCPCACAATLAPTTRSPASPVTCVPLVQTVAKEAGINIILVPSNFSSNMALFLEKAKWIVAEFSKFPPTDAVNAKGLNIWAAQEELPGDDGKHCWYNCSGVDRLLCCDQKLFTGLAAQSCGSGFVNELLVVHNNDKYGGAGGKGMGTTSVNEFSPQVAVHELGHSLFGLADEYSTGAGDQTRPNCDVAGCPKWADLKAAGMPGVGCKQSCAGGKFFAPELTIMDVLDAKFEEVNERITCCKFRFHGYVPGYCTKFNANGLSLDTYCAKQIWNGVAPVSAVTLLQVGSKEHLMARAADPQGELQTYVEKPQLWSLDKQPTGNWTCAYVQDLPEGLYRKEKVEGELNSVSHGSRTTNALKSAKIWLNIVKANTMPTTPRRKVKELLFHSLKNVEVPADVVLDPQTGKATGKWTLPDVMMPRNQIDFILSQGEACEIARPCSHC